MKDIYFLYIGLFITVGLIIFLIINNLIAERKKKSRNKSKENKNQNIIGSGREFNIQIEYDDRENVELNVNEITDLLVAFESIKNKKTGKVNLNDELAVEAEQKKEKLKKSDINFQQFKSINQLNESL
jgi:hypothetical protein